MDNLDNTQLPENEEKTASAVPGRDLYEWVRSLASAMLIIVLVFTFAVRMMGVQGGSMRQTLQDGDRLLVVNSGLVREYRQGDIVIARKQSFSDDPIVKRVIAVGGQTIDIDFNAGIVYVDGVALEEDYINDLTYTYEGTDFPLTVPEGSVFLMGDNRNMSTDSREPRIGPVDLRNLIGKAVFLVFPGPDTVTEKRDFGRIGLLRKG
ncbi:MAG: signal peptidase I [Ruminococcaceae bacterium]|jgi:signal peptidase I|nr:signal peptidase I [Oscillospiraceae bacterium]